MSSFVNSAVIDRVKSTLLFNLLFECPRSSVQDPNSYPVSTMSCVLFVPSRGKNHHLCWMNNNPYYLWKHLLIWLYFHIELSQSEIHGREWSIWNQYWTLLSADLDKKTFLRFYPKSPVNHIVNGTIVGINIQQTGSFWPHQISLNRNSQVLLGTDINILETVP